MMERSADAWEHNQFKEVVVKVANVEIYYKVRSMRLYKIHSSDATWRAGFELLPATTTYPDHRPLDRPDPAYRPLSSRPHVLQLG